MGIIYVKAFVRVDLPLNQRIEPGYKCLTTTC
jgi:hypothetical protein